MDEVRPGGTSVEVAPPPPAEVKIRTIKSDIAMLNASGGGLPRFENIHVSGLSPQEGSNQEAATKAVREGSKSNLMLIVVLVITFIALAVVGWLVYLKFVG